MDRIALIDDLARRESDAVVRTLAMMAYNPAIGRVLERNGVSKFQDLMAEVVLKLATISTRPAFDVFHAESCECIRQALKTHKGEKLS